MRFERTIAGELCDELGAHNQGAKRDSLDKKFAEALAEYMTQRASSHEDAATQMRFVREAIERAESAVASAAEPYP